MQAIGQLQHHHTWVLGHCQQHFAYSLRTLTAFQLVGLLLPLLHLFRRLRLGTVDGLPIPFPFAAGCNQFCSGSRFSCQRIKFGDAVYYVGYSPAKLLAQFFQCEISIFDDIMQQGCYYTIGIDPHIGQQQRDLERVLNIRVTRTTHDTPMCQIRNLVGTLNPLHLRWRKVLARFLQQMLKRHLGQRQKFIRVRGHHCSSSEVNSSWLPHT